MDIAKIRRNYGEHLTSVEIFKKYILPDIKNDLFKYIWVDLFCGEGNLILPILELLPIEERGEFFKNSIFLFDIQQKFIEKTINKAVEYGVPRKIAEKNILQRDTIKSYPDFILKLNKPVFHITNPPYLYIGYISKHKELTNYFEYFTGINEGYQDLYQLALINDLRNGIEKMIYIIPSNFLFGSSGSNKIRDDFLKFYNIKKAIIFEKKIFEFTGTNVIICYFEKKTYPKEEVIEFKGIKINNEVQEKFYSLNPKNHYRAGNFFEDFVLNYKTNNPIKVKYYLTMDDVMNNLGENKIKVLDANSFVGNRYKIKEINVNDKLYKLIRSNILFLRTIDTGSFKERAGIYLIREIFDVDGILVSKSPYRTHPIQIFFEPILTEEDQILLKDYFNLLLEYFREKTDSEFMTTYKYSNAKYIRKYLGLSQAKKLIETFPILSLNQNQKLEFKKITENKDAEKLILFLTSLNSKRRQMLWD